MSAPDTTPNLEPELPEMATLRERSHHERPPAILRENVKTRVWQTLTHTAGQHSLQPRGSAWTRTLLAAAVVAAVPGAFAATETGRQWALQGLSLLPWLDDAGLSSKPEAPTRDTPKQRSPSAPLPPPSATSAAIELATPAAADFPAEDVAAPTAPRGAALHAAPKLDVRAAPRAHEPVPGEEGAIGGEPAISHQLQAERQMLESARLALSRGDYAGARLWCTRHRTRFASPVLKQEREAIEALVAASEKPTSPSKKY